MGIYDRDYMRRRPEEESKLAKAKSAFSDFIRNKPYHAGVALIVVIVIVLALLKG